MRSVFNLASLFTRIPATIADKLRPAASRRSELSMKLAGVSGSQVRLTAWKSVDSERFRWNDALPYAHYKLPRLEITSARTACHPDQRFTEYFLPHSLAATSVDRRMMITGVKERAI